MIHAHSFCVKIAAVVYLRVKLEILLFFLMQINIKKCGDMASSSGAFLRLRWFLSTNEYFALNQCHTCIGKAVRITTSKGFSQCVQKYI